MQDYLFKLLVIDSESMLNWGPPAKINGVIPGSSGAV